MGFRTILVSGRAKIELKISWLTIRGEEEKRFHINEIDTLIIGTLACTITCQAMNALLQNNVNIIFCDRSMLPSAQVTPISGHFFSTGNTFKQIKWEDEAKTRIWYQIVRAKINWQLKILKEFGHYKTMRILERYLDEIQGADETNREGLASKAYFLALCGRGFDRRDDNEVNSCLNYGYSIMLSAVARDIVAAGYLTSIGIHHYNSFNKFNLACDIVEPFRPIVDYYVAVHSDKSNLRSLTTAILTTQVQIDGQRQYLDQAIRIFVRSVIDALEGERADIAEITRFYASDSNEI